MTEMTKLVIVGSGPAAWTAAIYASRAALSPIVLAGEQGGGQLMLTTEVENYPGFPEGIMGPELMAGMRKQAEKQGATIIDKDATALNKNGDAFIVRFGGTVEQYDSETVLSKTVAGKPVNQLTDSPVYRPTAYRSTVLPLHRSTGDSMNILKSKSVIVATGASANTLGLPGEDRLMGRGVGTCAVCDAPLYRGKDIVLVIGGGDSAAEEAGELAKFVKKVVILVRKDTMRASAVMHNRIKGLQNVEIWYKSEVKEFLGEKRLEKTRVVREGKEEVLAVDGAFYAIGHTPTTGWLRGSGVALDEKGYIITLLSAVISPVNQLSVFGSRLSDFGQSVVGQPVSETDKPKTGKPEAENRKQKTDNRYPTMTSVPGIFAAGDCVDPRYRQAITAAGYGCMAALDAQKWLENNGYNG